MKKRIFLAAALLPCLFVLSAWLLPENENWRSKIDATLLETATAGQTVEFLVVLQAQADVSNAKNLRGKTAKGAFVFQQLRATAAETQAPLLRILQTNSAPHRSFYVVNAILTKGDLSLLRLLAEHPATARIEGNPWIRMTGPVEEVATEPEGINWRNALEWGIQKIRADEVWNLGYTGQGVVVGGQDTGYKWDHAAIRDQYRGWNGATADHNYNWHDAISEISPLHNDSLISPTNNPCGLNATVPCDDHNHGTHTMGTMVGDDGNGNQIGVAPGARWIACRNMERGYGTPATYIDCFEWFLAPTDLNGQNPQPASAPHVINNSWGCPELEGCNASNWATMEAVVNNLKAAGVVVVVSAGNSGSSCHTVRDPAAIFEHSFSIGATRSNDTIANFSSRGSVTVDGSGRLKPNVAAPGVGVRSAIRNGGYASFSGTSMAGPHVAGLVALLISANPDLAGEVEVIETIIEQTAMPMLTTQDCGGFSGMEVPNAVYGHGRVDAFAAVERALELVSRTEQTLSESAVQVFPNPFRNEVQIHIGALHGPVRFELYSTSGKPVLQRRWDGGGAPLTETLNLDRLPAGVYWYKVVAAEGSRSGKLVKH
jgi:serine protease AprX